MVLHWLTPDVHTSDTDRSIYLMLNAAISFEKFVGFYDRTNQQPNKSAFN